MNTISKLIELNNTYWLVITSVLLLSVTYVSFRTLDFDFPPGGDKNLHLIVYCLLIIPAAIRNHRSLRIVVLSIFIWSGCIELIQPYFGRFGEWLDLLSNGCGLIIGVGIGLLISKITTNLNS